MNTQEKVRHIAGEINAGNLAILDREEAFIATHRTEIWLARNGRGKSSKQNAAGGCQRCDSTGMLNDDETCPDCSGTGDSDYVPPDYDEDTDFSCPAIDGPDDDPFDDDVDDDSDSDLDDDDRKQGDEDDDEDN